MDRHAVPPHPVPMFYWLVALLIGLLIVGYGIGFALGCRLPAADETERDA